MSGTLKRLNAGSAGIVDAARCPACGHPARTHNRNGCVFGPCECVVTTGELRPDAPRLEVPDGIELTPAVKAAPPSDGGGGHAAQGRPGQADAAAAPPVVPVRPSSAWDPPKVGPLPPLPGADAPRTPAMPGELPPLPPKWSAPLSMPAPATPDEGVARPRLSTARPAASRALGAAVVGEPGAVGEVAVASTGAAAAEPQPLDPERFLSLAVYSYAAWYCDRCHQRRHDPGACPDCRRTLQPVYVAIVPRSLT